MRDAIKKFREKIKAEGGFTLIELMAVLAILAIIAIIAVPAIGSIMKNAETKADTADVEMIEKAAGIAYVAQGGVPSKVPAAGYTVQSLVTGGYLDYDYTATGARKGHAKLQPNGTFLYAKTASEPVVVRN